MATKFLRQYENRMKQRSSYMGAMKIGKNKVAQGVRKDDDDKESFESFLKEDEEMTGRFLQL